MVLWHVSDIAAWDLVLVGQLAMQKRKISITRLICPMDYSVSLVELGRIYNLCRY